MNTAHTSHFPDAGTAEPAGVVPATLGARATVATLVGLVGLAVPCVLLLTPVGGLFALGAVLGVAVLAASLVAHLAYLGVVALAVGISGSRRPAASAPEITR